MIKKVNNLKIGDTFEYDKCEFEVTGFSSRYSVLGKIKEYTPGKPNTCKVPIKDITIKNENNLDKETCEEKAYNEWLVNYRAKK